jgi:formylglycine-generating enzyme required for sulfatase activity
MVEYEASTFTMGVEDMTPGPYGDAWFIDQQPAHSVTLSPFSLDETETTVAEFAMFLTHAAGEYHFDPDQPIERVDGGYLPIEGREDEPIHHVTWEAAHHYCLWAGKRLPTEAEWERAAAGEEGRTYPWGDEGADCHRANYFTGSTYCEDMVVPVGTRSGGSTPEGVLDMAGNVGEWVADRYGFYSPDGAPETDPTGPAGGTMRVVRGGGFLDSGLSMQSRNRRGASPTRGSENIGFRCAHDGPSSDGALRGELSAPSDAGLEPTDRPLAPATDLPEVVAEGFARPTALVSLQDILYLLDESEGTLLALADDGDSVEPLVEGLDRPLDLATDGTALFITDQTAGEVLRVEMDGSIEVVASAQANPTYLAVDTDGVFWIADGGVMRGTDEGGAEPLAEIPGVNGIALSPTHLYYTSDGGDTAANAVVDRVPRAGGAPEDLVGYSTFGVQYYPTNIVFDVAGDRALFLYRRRPAPGTYLCELPGGVAPHNYITYSPLVDPGVDIEVVDGQVFWGTQQTLVRIDSDSDDTFSELGGWTRPRGVVSTSEGIVWTDWIDGRIYRLDP